LVTEKVFYISRKRASLGQAWQILEPRFVLRTGSGLTWREELEELVELELDRQRREDGVVDERRPGVVFMNQP
jgi:hypothetical protein